jgi:hypothetical protein
MSNDSFVDFRAPDGRFTRGNPGGPGRPRARECIVALDQLVAASGAELIEAALKEAKAGNVKAIELLLRRIWPARHGRPVEIAAPEIRGIPDLLPASTAVTNAVLNGDVTPDEGQAAVRVLDRHRSIFVLADLQRQIAELQAEDVEARGRAR